MENINILVENQRDFFHTHQTKDLNFRINSLKNLQQGVRKYEKEILNALYEDLNKSDFEGYMTEVGMVLEELRFVIENLPKWVKPQKVKTPIAQFPAKSKIYSEPYGVVLIMSPWNYPFQLTIEPLIGALAAGNCAVIKPSNYSLNTSKVIDKIISEIFDPKYVTTVLGGRDANKNLLEEKFDYIFFTGGTTVGKVVMEAASKNLTPLSLELGGKSPCIVDETANLELAAKRIVWGKYINAGQTCVAPDYLLVHKNVKSELIEKMKKYISKFYGENPLENKDLPKIINEHHFDRLYNLINKENIIAGGKSNRTTNKIEPTILDGISWDDEIMKDEIFGPILPIIEFDDLTKVVEKVNDRPKPLALYFFTTSKVNERMVLKNISYGGGCLNDTVIHLATSYLPFGGVGNSGMGSYHGKASFDTFSHKKSVMKKSNYFDIPLRYPPYRKLSLLKKFLK